MTTKRLNVNKTLVSRTRLAYTIRGKYGHFAEWSQMAAEWRIRKINKLTSFGAFSKKKNFILLFCAESIIWPNFSRKREKQHGVNVLGVRSCHTYSTHFERWRSSFHGFFKIIYSSTTQTSMLKVWSFLIVFDLNVKKNVLKSCGRGLIRHTKL